MRKLGFKIENSPYHYYAYDNFIKILKKKMKKLILIHGMFIIMKNHIKKMIKKFMMV